MMRLPRTVSLLLALSLLGSSATAQDRIISKPFADMIFAFTRAQWENYVRQIAAPAGWTLRLLPQDTGTGLARFNQSSGMGACPTAVHRRSGTRNAPGIGHVAVGMHRQATTYNSLSTISGGGRATSYTSRMEHSYQRVR